MPARNEIYPQKIAHPGVGADDMAEDWCSIYPIIPAHPGVDAGDNEGEGPTTLYPQNHAHPGVDANNTAADAQWGPFVGRTARSDATAKQQARG